MSPEQVQGAALTGACDQFSLAVIAYEVLCGRKAFSADTVEALLYKIRNEREEPVDKLNPALSPTVRKVMQCAMAKAPDLRFGTCSEFAGALEFRTRRLTQVGAGRFRRCSRPCPQGSCSLRSAGVGRRKIGSRRMALLAGLIFAVGLAIVGHCADEFRAADCDASSRYQEWTGFAAARLCGSAGGRN